MASASPATARPRRQSAEVRDLLLEAGREEFAARGFGGATTREIAARAGVAEVLLFRHFGSKAGLFVQSVLRPLQGFVEEEVSRVATDPGVSIEELMRGFIGHLYDLLSANRELFLALVSVAEFDPEVLADAADTDVGDLWEVLEQVTAAVRADRGQPPVDAMATTRATIGMVMAMVLLDGFLFSPGGRPDRERAVDAMTWLIVNGVREDSNRPEDRPA
jgi:AcrR family transcriptional regulator